MEVIECDLGSDTGTLGHDSIGLPTGILTEGMARVILGKTMPREEEIAMLGEQER
jgi:hypothetical protein